MDAFDVALKDINERISTVAASVSSGSCNSFDEYKHRCGEIWGLKTAASYIADLKHKMEHDDE